jgi:hypothetical protein
VDNIKYDAIINNKDLWVLSQDMSKAYDHVNLFMLIRALERLRIPFNFIRFILKMFGNRFNQVFTFFGNTEPYKVVFGIDQGEVISPLLWCIYYDPLLCRIHESPLGYSMSHKWKPDVSTSAIATNSIKISTLAYMDDTLWITKSQKDLTDIMKIANSFYDLNFIKVNWDKSVLLTNKDTLCQSISLPSINGGITIHPRLTNESIKYLGVWISLGSNKAFINKSLANKIKSAVAVMTPKRLMDKQIIYIYNSVLIPQIEYHSQLTFFTQQ